MGWIRRLHETVRGSRLERDLDDEIRFHLDQRTEEYVRRGLDAREAREKARRRFGNVTLVKERARDIDTVRWLDELRQDLRYALCVLRRSPGLTFVAVFSLALGIGANTAIFSLIDRLVLRTAPIEDPWRVVQVNRTGPGGQGPVLSYPTYQFLRDHNAVFTDLAATGRIVRLSVTVPPAQEPERIAAELVSGNYFSLLGVRAWIGRTLIPDDSATAGAGGAQGAVAVVSYAYWKRRFAADVAVIGRTLTLSGTSFTIVGVADPTFSGIEVADPVDLWVPVAMQPRIVIGQNWLDQPGNNWLRALGRLKPNVTPEQASAATNTLFALLPNATGQQIQLLNAAYGLSMLRERVSFSLGLLMCAAGVVLLIACANIANLLLAKANWRHKEMTLRLALGATRGRVIRQLLSESLMLSVGGGVIGLILARWTGQALATPLLPAGGRAVPLELDTRVLAFTLVMSALTSVLFGLVPALRASRLALVDSLKQRVDLGTRHTRRLAAGLVAAQVALSVVLLVAAGLFARTFQNLRTTDAGFEQANVVIVRLDPRATGYSAGQVSSVYRQLLDRINALPGVRAAAFSDLAPFGGVARQRSISVQGFLSKPGDDLNPYVITVSPRYFETMGIAVVKGRAFDSHDELRASQVAIVSERFASYYFGAANPVGRRFGFGGSNESGEIEIVGVAKDIKLNDLREQPLHVVYTPTTFSLTNTTLAVRGDIDTRSIANSVRQEILAVDGTLPIVSLTTLRQQVEQSLGNERITALLSTFFGGLALLLACIGLYAVMAYTTARKTNEIGIRLALGATPADVLRMVLRESLVMVVSGIVIGIPAALATTHVVSSKLVGVSAADPVTMALAIALMTSIGAFASFLPAHRASRTDPMVALRNE